MDGTLIVITTPGDSKSGSDSNEGILEESLELDPHY